MQLLIRVFGLLKTSTWIILIYMVLIALVFLSFDVIVDEQHE
jgi:hypothetical protein